MYEIKGFVFLENEGQIIKYALQPGNIVSNWEAAHDLMKKNGINHYLFTLVEVK